MNTKETIEMLVERSGILNTDPDGRSVLAITSMPSGPGHHPSPIDKVAHDMELSVVSTRDYECIIGMHSGWMLSDDGDIMCYGMSNISLLDEPLPGRKQ